MRTLSNIQKKLFWVGLLIVGLGFIVFSIIGLRNADTFLPTTATIESIEKTYEAQDQDDSDVYEVMVSYTVDGKEYVSDLGVMKDDYAVGKQIDIIYDPEDPSVITLPGKTGSIIFIAIGAVAAALAVFMILRKDPSSSRDPEVLEEHSNGITYAPSSQGDERELYFLTDLGTMKFGHRIEDADRRVLYEAKVTRYAALGDIEMDFIDHVKGITEAHRIGHEVNIDYGSMLADTHSSFTYDGEDIWAHLRRNGVSVETGFTQGKIMALQFRIFRNGEEIAFAESTGASVHEEDEASKGKLAKKLSSRYFYRIWTREKNVDLIFITLMAFARSSANDDEGGNLGLFFGKKN